MAQTKHGICPRSHSKWMADVGPIQRCRVSVNPVHTHQPVSITSKITLAHFPAPKLLGRNVSQVPLPGFAIEQKNERKVGLGVCVCVCVCMWRGTLLCFLKYKPGTAMRGVCSHYADGKTDIQRGNCLCRGAQ